MVSTYTSRLRLEKPAKGDYNNTWATPNNGNLDLVDQAIAGVTSIDCTTGSNITLSALNATSDQSRSAILVLTGIPSAQISVLVPNNVSKQYTVRSKHTGSNFVLIRNAALGAACTCDAGERFNMFTDGVSSFKLGQLPKKTIVAWNGTTSNIPAGWRICNGSNGTPDLSTRFIRAGTSVGSNTGSNTLAIASAGGHNHGGNAGNTTLDITQIPSHNHTIEIYNTPVNIPSGAPGDTALDLVATSTNSGNAGGGGSHTHTISTDGAHTHSLSGTVEPDSFTLIFIQKVT